MNQIVSVFVCVYVFVCALHHMYVYGMHVCVCMCTQGVLQHMGKKVIRCGGPGSGGTYTHTYTHTYIHTYIHIYSYIYIHTYIHILFPQTHTCTFTHEPNVCKHMSV